VSSQTEIGELQAEVDYNRNRVSLRRARLYRLGLGHDVRLQALERNLESAQKRLRDAKLRARP
jgi:hypothetical protein